MQETARPRLGACTVPDYVLRCALCAPEESAFVRGYTAGHTAGLDFLSNPRVVSNSPAQSTLRVLVLGPACGGAWVGLIDALRTQLTVSRIHLDFLDCGHTARRALPCMVRRAARGTGMVLSHAFHEMDWRGDGAYLEDALYRSMPRLDALADFVLVHETLFVHSSGTGAWLTAALDLPSMWLRPFGCLLALRSGDALNAAAAHSMQAAYDRLRRSRSAVLKLATVLLPTDQTFVRRAVSLRYVSAEAQMPRMDAVEYAAGGFMRIPYRYGLAA